MPSSLMTYPIITYTDHQTCRIGTQAAEKAAAGRQAEKTLFSWNVHMATWHGTGERHSLEELGAK
jgi:hypothetical protein